MFFFFLKKAEVMMNLFVRADIYMNKWIQTIINICYVLILFLHWNSKFEFIMMNLLFVLAFCARREANNLFGLFFFLSVCYYYIFSLLSTLSHNSIRSITSFTSKHAQHTDNAVQLVCMCGALITLITHIIIQIEIIKIARNDVHVKMY